MVNYEEKSFEFECVWKNTGKKHDFEKYVGRCFFMKMVLINPCNNNQTFVDENEKHLYIKKIQKKYDIIKKTTFYKDNEEEIVPKIALLQKQTENKKKYFEKAFKLYIKVYNSCVFNQEFLNEIGPDLWISYHKLYRFIFDNWENVDYDYISLYITTLDGLKCLSVSLKDDWLINDYQNDKNIVKPVLKLKKNWTKELYEYMKYMCESYSYEFCEQCNNNFETYGVLL
tara:strand:- start:1896 stop:2579 length:684 start_codon:yes stop_codon:yes gene_type:complete